MDTTVTDQYMLTTIDNPWNPYTDWDAWYAWDHAHGYDTPNVLARLSSFSVDLTEAEQEQIIKNTIDEIVQINITGRYKKIRPEDKIKI